MLDTVARNLAGAFTRLGSLLLHDRRAEKSDRLVRPLRRDSERTYPSVGLTPSRALALLRAADAGEPNEQYELYQEMLHRWPRLAAVEATRRIALTGLDWEIAPAADCPAGADPAARSAAEHVRETLTRLDAFGDVLDHLSTAIGFGAAVAEIVWEAGRVIDVVPVPHARLLADSDEPWRLRIRTADEPSRGVPLDEYPHKFIVHRPGARPGFEFAGGLLRASTLLYVAQNLSFKDWLAFSEIAGMPLRVARFDPGLPNEDQHRLLRMMSDLGRDAVAVISKNVELNLVEPSRGGDKPYKPLQDHCNREITILWLGQHLTTDIQQSGSRAAAEIHDRVREDLLVHDMNAESRTLRRDLLGPLARMRFGDGAPPPHFRRSLVQSFDTRVLAETLAVAVQRLGMRVPRRWVHRALGIPEPAGDEPTLGADESNAVPQGDCA